jgi:diguanylate cyclase (GGDEF)-like protein
LLSLVGKKEKELLHMQQNKESKEHKILPMERNPISGSMHNTASHLTTLRNQLPKDSKALQGIKTALTLLKRIDTTQKASTKNNGQLKELKQQLAQALNTLSGHLKTQNHDQFQAIKNTFQQLESSLQDPSILERSTQDRSTASEHLHSMGLDQIVTMINAAAIHEPEWMSRTGTILILDNNPNTSQALNRRLSKEGHTVLNAEDEGQAFTYLQTISIEAILVDYLMFKDDLYAFLKKIENEPNQGYIPIIVIGAPESAEVMQKITEAGVGDYLAKPVNPVLLKMRVHAVLEKKYAFEQRVMRTQEMQRTRQELESAIQDLPDGFAIFDQTDHMVMHNDKLFEFYPQLTHQTEIIRGGLTFEKLLEANVAAGIYRFESEEQSKQWIEQKKVNFLLPASQWEESLSNGLVLGVTTYRTPDGGGALVAKDISKDKAHHQDLTFLAYHDSLTGLPNRKAFHQKLSQSLLHVDELKDQLLAVLFLDLDGFKDINDTYGHEMGDWLLNQVGQRLRRCIRGDDLLARFGGDEFCIILNHAANRAKVEMVANRILKSISDPYIRDGIAMHVGVSIGIGVYTRGIEDSETLLKEADTALYEVKESGKGAFRFFDEISQKNGSREPKQTKSNKNWKKNAHRPKEIA